MTHPAKSGLYRNIRYRDPRLRDVRSMVPEILLELLNQEKVAARVLQPGEQVRVRAGNIKQPGQSTTNYLVYDEGEPGDYVVTLRGGPTVIRKAFFEANFELIE